MRKCSCVATLVLGVVLSITAAPAESPQPPLDGERFDELEEVVVRGKRLYEAIVEAEDEFFKLYNEVDKNRRYRIQCVRLNANPDKSFAGTDDRVCMPGFMVDATVDWTGWKVRCQPEFSDFDGNRDGGISIIEAQANRDLATDMMIGGKSRIYPREFEEWARDVIANANCHIPPPPELVLMDGSAAWQQHMLEVTNSDPRLHEMADRLGGMYYELRTAQLEYRNRYRERKEDAAPREKTTRRGAGPR